MVASGNEAVIEPGVTGLDDLAAALVSASGSPWVFLALFALTVADALLPIIPSETAVVALGTLAASAGFGGLWWIVPVAAIGAFAGDALLFWIGRRGHLDRWRWATRPRAARVITWAKRGLRQRAAALIITARYIPLGRIAVSVTAGATGLPARRYFMLSALACVLWALYNVGIGAFFGAWLGGNPVLAVVISVIVALGLGIVIDLALNARARRRGVPE